MNRRFREPLLNYSNRHEEPVEHVTVHAYAA